MKWRLWHFTVGIGIFLLLSGMAGKRDSELPQFVRLNEWLAKGGQPTEEGIRQLKNRGFRTVINFREESDWIEWEKKAAAEAGLNYVTLPWTIWRDPGEGFFDDFFKILEDPQNRPVFFHCKHGRDRSGVMGVVSLMRYGHLDEAQARRSVFGEVSPHLQYRFFVRQRIQEYLKREVARASSKTP